VAYRQRERIKHGIKRRKRPHERDYVGQLSKKLWSDDEVMQFCEQGSVASDKQHASGAGTDAKVRRDGAIMTRAIFND
jgi:hypothetical protein